MNYFNYVLCKREWEWKTAVIKPITKIAAPTQPSDRPISIITPVLSQSLERIVVREFICPALIKQYQTLNFCDQFAFRPTGSTTAAIVAITVRSLLADNDFVHVFAFDFSKAFDKVRHVTLAGKLAHLELPESIYNWAVDFLDQCLRIRIFCFFSDFKNILFTFFLNDVSKSKKSSAKV